MQGVHWQARASALGGEHVGGPGQSGGSMLSAFANPLSILNATHAGTTGKLQAIARNWRGAPQAGHASKQPVPEPGDFYYPSCA